MKVYGYREHIDVERVKSWLIVVTANQVRDYFRKNSVRKEFVDKDGILSETPEQRNSIDAYLYKQGIKELQIQMLQGLRRKNLLWYDVFVLVEYLEIPRKVVAKKHGIALSTVDSYLKKSRKWMSEKYQKDFDEL